MNKEKFHIPMPDERAIQMQIAQIVASGVKQKESFLSYLKSMVQQVGLRHLFSDRLELVYITFMALTAFVLMFILAEPKQLPVQDLYGIIFLLSPILFLSFSVYTYVNKVRNDTFEIEMSCRYNVYQIIVFKMLVFSAVSIVINTITIAFIVLAYEDIQFLRAFMISITALFTFSILFLYGMMKRRTTVAAAMLIVCWIVGNLLLRISNYTIYTNILVTLPLFVYGIVLIGSMFFYLKYLNRLIHFKQTEGAF
ncbi:hypothetical protein FQ087_05625 [Sporosarcina sp. ANT_H38]|uniref:hypothetical protein n=1 Tax=Sporosarcina sp. ANT_H38 TaxID=2597358 RepID=UPI0011F27451|nr:hypothetical protein [Sporosarcina sp. ANT_H38]KAA0965759.1 hypothetical protein FQ087_05625 [Sporosarcina sp. ANT_H38]